MSKSSESGQIVLITLLLMTIVSMVGLSLVGRVTTDTAISKQLEESAKAFSAAEAGVEAAISSGEGGTFTLSPDVSSMVTVNSLSGASGVYQLPRKTPKGTVETFWLVGHNDDGSLDETPVFTSPSLEVCWTQESTDPAIVANVLYKEGTDQTYKVARAAFDPDVSRVSLNKFDNTVDFPGCSLPGYYGKSIIFDTLGISLSGPAADTLLALRLQPLYNEASLAVNSPQVLPVQGYRLDSVGTTQSGISRKVVVYQQYRAPQAVFDYGIYSQATITK